MNNEKKELWDAFLQEWPLERLQSMSLEEYTNLNREDSFCYWLESKTEGLGSIWGGSSYKFGIYHRSKSAKKDKRFKYKTQGNYSWVLKFGETKEDAFKAIRENIVAVARFATQNELDKAENVELGHVVKWKIAALYNKRIPLLYSKEAIDFICDHFSIDKQLPYSAKLQNLASLNKGNDMLTFSEELWAVWDQRKKGTSDSNDTGINYWVFQGNPKIYNVVDSLKNKALKSWSVAAHKDKIQQGDKVILWLTGEKSGCYALCRVTSGVMNRIDDEIEQKYYNDLSKFQSADRVQIAIEHNLWQNPVLKEYLNDMPEFQDFKGGNQGTNFAASKLHYDIILKHINMIELKQFPLNQIFFGPPGTGKTYNTINKCIEILDPLFDLTQPRKIIKDKFEFLRKEGRIDLVTFHQSMSYEDFVEGIKPFVPVDSEAGDDNSAILPTLMYKIEDGIFKRLCMRATTNISQKFDFDDLWDNFATKLIASNDEVVFKSVDSELKLEKEISSINSLKVRFKKSWNDSEPEGTAIFHVGKETMRNIFNERINLADPNLKPRVAVSEIVGTSRATTFYAVYRSFFEHSNLVNMFSQTDTTLPFVIIIDEINRGNISQIFGELITLIEDDKRQAKPEALEAILPYSKTKFSIPQNVYIIGTMNTADRSIEALDTALRRRFTFMEMAPKPELISEVGKSKGEIDGIDLVKLLSTINERIEKLIDKDHQIGHSYFLDIASFTELKLAFKNKVIPLLEEYFYGDFGKIGLVLGSGFVIPKKMNDFGFADFKGFDNDIITDLMERKVFEITDSKAWGVEDFKNIYQK